MAASYVLGLFVHVFSARMFRVSLDINMFFKFCQTCQPFWVCMWKRVILAKRNKQCRLLTLPRVSVSRTNWFEIHLASRLSRRICDDVSAGFWSSTDSNFSVLARQTMNLNVEHNEQRERERDIYRKNKKKYMQNIHLTCRILFRHITRLLTLELISIWLNWAAEHFPPNATMVAAYKFAWNTSTQIYYSFL